MIDIIKFDFDNISPLEVIVQAMKDIRKNFPADKILYRIDQKVKSARLLISSKLSIEEQLIILLKLFYCQWKFSSAKSVHKFSDMLWLDCVLRNKQGIHISLGIIFLYIAKKLNFLISPIVFPTQLILKVFLTSQKYIFLDPLSGDIINKKTLLFWLKGNISPIAKIKKKYLQETTSLKLVQKFLDTLKIALVEEKCIELALYINSILLKITPEDPYEIRDRGLILVKLHCYNAAILDLMYFAERCPEDPISEIVKIQIHNLQQKKNILH